jgi:hypothetical protein
LNSFLRGWFEQVQAEEHLESKLFAYPVRSDMGKQPIIKLKLFVRDFDVFADLISSESNVNVI